jgi:hypothetical protein
MCQHAVPAIYLYPESQMDVTVRLRFGGSGFMTASFPQYNDGWRIRVDPAIPYRRYRELFGAQHHYPFLDYDGLREGPYQKDAGWCIETSAFMEWQRESLRALNFPAEAIEDAVYHYGRLLADKRIVERHLLVYPQPKPIVDQAVALEISPKPEYVYRLWFYIVPSERAITLRTPQLERVQSQGFSAIELGYLTDGEIPEAQAMANQRSSQVLTGLYSPFVKQIHNSYARGEFK